MIQAKRLADRTEATLLRSICKNNVYCTHALIVPSRPIRFWLLILSLQVLPQNKIKLISSEKKLPQLFDFIWAPRTEVPGLNDIKKLHCHWLLILFLLPPLLLQIKTQTDFV